MTRKSKKLNQREAWLLMAEHWRTRTRGSLFSSCGSQGLCDCLIDIRKTGAISAGIYETMETRIMKVKCLPRSGYSWPRTKQGAQARRRFCLRMAHECEEQVMVAPRHEPNSAPLERQRNTAMWTYSEVPLRWSDNVLVLEEKDHTEFLRVDFLSVPGSQTVARLTRYGVPGRYDIYCFEFAPKKAGYSSRIEFHGEETSLPEALKMLHWDLQKPAVIELLSTYRVKDYWNALGDLLKRIAPDAPITATVSQVVKKHTMGNK